MKLFKSSSLFKKSFTLVELSTVLLVLSVLTGTLLVGRKIVDRANIQRVIFEIDKYKTEFYQFQDTYGVLPGNVDEETCMKNTEFYSAQTQQDKFDGKEIEIPVKIKSLFYESSNYIKGVIKNEISKEQYPTEAYYLSQINIHFKRMKKALSDVKNLLERED